MGFPKQEYWSGLPFPSPGDLPDPGIEPVSSALPGWFFTSEPHILCNTCGLGSVFLGYPCNFAMVFSIWALQLETGQLRVTEAHDLSEVLTPLCQLCRKVYFILSPKLVSLYLLLFCSCSQEEWDGGSSLSPSGPALWSPLTLPNILFSCSWFLQINFMALWFPVFSVSVRVPTGNTGTN